MLTREAANIAYCLDDHIICALTYPPSVTYDANRAAQNLEPTYQPIVNAVAHQAGDYELIDAHMCPYQGRNYAHLVYRSGDHKLSVFAEAADRGRLPLRHESPRKGYVTTGSSSGQHQVFVVSDGEISPPANVVSELMRSTLVFVKTLER